MVGKLAPLIARAPCERGLRIPRPWDRDIPPRSEAVLK